MESSSTPTGRPGQIGAYRVIKTIGAGGMAEVLKVEDTRTGQYRALKTYYGPTSDETVLLRYRREHRAMARLDHPNIAHTYECGVHDGRPFLVTEFIPGVSLTEFLEERDLSPGPERDKMAALLGIQIASALEHIHSRNLVHRDLKPANILVTSEEVVKLIDFDIAQDMAQEIEPTDGDVVGTYAFCSPEQASGIPLDHRSDLYSLGVVLYLLVTNQLPFVAEQAIAYILKHVNAPPEPPETWYPTIPAPLRDIILGLLQKKPIDRPQSARDVEQVLKAYVEGVFQEQQRSSVLLTTLEATRRTAGRLYEPAFVGRENELAVIEGAVSLLQAGASGIMLVVGEFGGGRSRLMDEAMADVRARGLPVFGARCMPDGQTAYQGVAEIVDQLVASLQGRELDLIQVMLGAHLPILARAFPSIATLFPGHAAPTGDSDPRFEIGRMQAALRALLDAALPGPAVIELKDLQWTDGATMRLIAAVAMGSRDPAAAPILWLASVATDELAAGHPLQVWLAEPPAEVELLHVPPLELSEVEAMVRSMLGGRASIGPLAEALHTESRGNPSLIAEAVRGLVDRGELLPHRADGENTGWTFVGGGEGVQTISLVRTIHQTLVDRLAPLSPAALDLVERAAVVGRPCSFELLRQTTRFSSDALLDVVDDVLSRRILVERKGRGSSLFSFFHPRMAEVVIGRIDPARKVQLHREIADALLVVQGETELATIEQLGAQLYQGQLYGRAAAYLLRAADARIQLGLYDAALRPIEWAVECCRQDPYIEPKLYVSIHLRFGQVLHQLGDLDRAVSSLRTAHVGSQQHGYVELQAQILYSLAGMAARQGDFAASCKQYAEAMKVLRSAGGDAGWLIRSLTALATSLFYVGDLPHARKLFEEACNSAKKLGEPALLAQAINGLGLVAGHDGRFGDAVTLLSEAATLSRTGARDANYALYELNLAEMLRAQGDLGLARERSAGALALLERIGDREGLIFALNVHTSIALELRDLDRAEALATRSGELLTRTTQHYGACQRLLHVGQLELLRGRPVEAQLLLSEALTLSESWSYRELRAKAHRLLGTALVQCGSPGEGLGLIHRAVVESEVLGNPPGMAEARLCYAEGLVAQGDRGEALTMLDHVLRPLLEIGMRLHVVRCMVLRSRLAMEQGQGAGAQLEQALSLARDIRGGLTPEERMTFDSRPEIKLLGALWRMITT